MLEWLNSFYIQLHLSPSSYSSSEEHKEEAVQEDSEEEGNLIWFSSSIQLFFSLDFLLTLQSFIIPSLEEVFTLARKENELMLKATIYI